MRVTAKSNHLQRVNKGPRLYFMSHLRVQCFEFCTSLHVDAKTGKRAPTCILLTLV